MSMDEITGIGADTGRGHNIMTVSGKPFWPFDPRPEDVRLGDIAHSLSMQCRFNGHTTAFYSVAQHCVIMAQGFFMAGETELAREALLHDAAEAYIGDLIRPVKAHCPDWCAMDARLDGVIRARFGLPPVMSAEVRDADLRMCVTERRDLCAASPEVDWGDLPEPFQETISPWGPGVSRSAFLNVAAALGVE